MSRQQKEEACCPAHAYHDKDTYYYDERDWNYIPERRAFVCYCVDTDLIYFRDQDDGQITYAPTIVASEYAALVNSLQFPWVPAAYPAADHQPAGQQGPRQEGPRQQAAGQQGPHQQGLRQQAAGHQAPGQEPARHQPAASGTPTHVALDKHQIAAVVAELSQKLKASQVSQGPSVPNETVASQEAVAGQHNGPSQDSPGQKKKANKKKNKKGKGKERAVESEIPPGQQNPSTKPAPGSSWTRLHPQSATNQQSSGVESSESKPESKPDRDAGYETAFAVLQPGWSKYFTEEYIREVLVQNDGDIDRSAVMLDEYRYKGNWSTGKFSEVTARALPGNQERPSGSPSANQNQDAGKQPDHGAARAGPDGGRGGQHSGRGRGMIGAGSVSRGGRGGARGGRGGGVTGPQGMRLPANSRGAVQGSGSGGPQRPHLPQDPETRFIRRADFYRIPDADHPRFLPPSDVVTDLRVYSDPDTIGTLRDLTSRKGFIRGVAVNRYDPEKEPAPDKVMSEETLKLQDTMLMQLWFDEFGSSLDEHLAEFEPEEHNMQAHAWMETRALKIICARCRAFKLACNHHIPCQFCKAAGANCLVQFCPFNENCTKADCEKVHQDLMEAVAAEFQRLGFHGQKSSWAFFDQHWYSMPPAFYPRCDGVRQLHWQTQATLPPSGSGKPYNKNNTDGFDVNRYPEGPPWLLRFCKDGRWTEYLFNELEKQQSQEANEAKARQDAKEAKSQAALDQANDAVIEARIKEIRGEDAGDLESEDEEKEGDEEGKEGNLWH